MKALDFLLNPLNSLLNSVVSTVPSLVAAFVVVVFGYVVALLFHWLVSQAGSKVKLDNFLVKKTNLQKVLGDFSFTKFLALLAKWYTFILFLPSAASTLSGKMVHLASFLEYVALWIPKVIAGVLVATLGLMAAKYVEAKVQELKFKSASIVASASKLVIVIFAALLAFKQIGFDIAIAENTFLVIVAGVVLAFALAVGISFGLALKDEAKSTFKSIKSKL